MSKGKTTTTQEANVPGYLQDLYQEMSSRGMAAADIPFTPYTGEMVAGFTPDQLQAMQSTRGLFSESMDFDPRQRISELAAASSPTLSPVSGAAASLLDTNFQQYEDPYTEAVLQPALEDIARRQDIATQRAQDRAIGAGAFGGSRSALIESEATRPFAEEAAQTIAGLRSAGFDRATRLAEADTARRQQIELANLETRARQGEVAARLELENRRQQAGLLGGQLTDQFRTLGLLSGVGGQQQALAQARLEAQRAEFDRELGFPAYQLGLLTTAAGGVSPYVIGKTETTRRSTGLGDILGAAAGLGGAIYTGGFNPFGFASSTPSLATLNPNYFPVP